VVLAGIFSIYRWTPEPAPDGVSVEPLGEAFGPSEFPDGLMVLLGAVVVGPELLPLPMPVVPPVVVPVLLPLMDVPPAPELAPAEPPPPAAACANANVLESVKAAARAIVVSFIVSSSCVMSAIQRPIDILCSG
jgi:hypothetical protein